MAAVLNEHTGQSIGGQTHQGSPISAAPPSKQPISADLIAMEPDPKNVERLLQDLCTTLGFSMAVRDAERFIPLVHQGPATFADTVLLAEGLDPTLERRLRRDVLEFVEARFHQWTSQAAPNQRHDER